MCERAGAYCTDEDICTWGLKRCHTRGVKEYWRIKLSTLQVETNSTGEHDRFSVNYLLIEYERKLIHLGMENSE